MILPEKVIGQSGVAAFRLEEFRERFDVRELGGKGWLAIGREEGSIWVRFAVLEFCESNADGSDVLVTGVFHGEGPSGNLRECRHTWWGEDGYLFYANGPLITAAFVVLSEFFDGMVAKEGA